LPDKKTENVSLRDIMELQMCIVKKINEIKLQMERYKIKVLFVAGFVALTVSLTVSLGIRIGLALWGNLIGL
jgi:hypothetical protein